jgi:hypothetical protein
LQPVSLWEAFLLTSMAICSMVCNFLVLEAGRGNQLELGVLNDVLGMNAVQRSFTATVIPWAWISLQDS